MPRRILYVGAFKFPNGDAGGRRVLGLGRCLRDLGFEVRYFGTEAEGRIQDLSSEGTYLYDGFSYEPSGISRRTNLRRAWRLLYVHLTGLNAISRIKKRADRSTSAIIAYQASSPLLFLLRRFCDVRRIPLIADTVEWYDRGHAIGGKLGPFALDSELRMRYFQKQADGVIAISRLLENYYAGRDKNVIRIPPLIDLNERCWNERKIKVHADKQIRLVFIGSAGKKDLVANAIRGLRLLGIEAQRFRLLIVGPSLNELRKHLGSDARLLYDLKDSLEIKGRVPWEKALTYLASAHFSFFLRPDARFAHAGFPTKLVESFAMRVPVIVNLTGDIPLYVRDGLEGIIVRSESPQAFAEGMRRALGLNNKEKDEMRRSARLRAEECFDYRRWLMPLGAFMKNILN